MFRIFIAPIKVFLKNVKIVGDKKKKNKKSQNHFSIRGGHSGTLAHNLKYSEKFSSTSNKTQNVLI